MQGEDKIGRLRRAMYSRKVAGTFGDNRRHELSAEHPNLQEDWTPLADNMATPGMSVAPRAIRYTRRALLVLFGIALLFFLAALGVFAWYVFGGFGTDVRANNIDIEIEGPLAVIGGEAAELQIIVTNRNKAPLQYADLIVSYPKGTRSVTDLSTDLPSQRISLGTIDPGATRQGTVSSVLIGEGGKEDVIQVTVEYQVEGGNAIFTANEDYEFTFAAAPVSIAIEARSEVIPGQPLSLTATVSTNANTVLKNVLLQMEAPFGFTVSASNPQMQENNMWNLGDLRPGDVRTIQIQGVMKGQTGDERVFRFSVGTEQATGTKGIAVPLVKVEQKITLTQPFIGLSLGIDQDTSNKAAVARPGQVVRVSVNWKNELTTPITDVVFVASLSGLPIEGERVRSNDGFYRSVDNTVVWDGNTSRGVLKTLAPGASGTVGFEFTTPSEAQLETLRNPSINISIRAAADRSDQGNVPQGLESTAIRTIKLLTSASALAQGFYNSNPFGSSGVVPPKVNKETTYAILLTAGNSTNPVEKGKITAQLPPYVRWTGIFSPGTEKLTFDQKNGTVTWDIGTLSAGTGVGGSAPRQVAFEIGFTPSSNQIGQTPSLVTNIKLEGKDSFTGTELQQTLPNITTVQPNDPGFVSANAKVVQ